MAEPFLAMAILHRAEVAKPGKVAGAFFIEHLKRWPGQAAEVRGLSVASKHPHT
jgi:hypothetical protein